MKATPLRSQMPRSFSNNRTISRSIPQDSRMETICSRTRAAAQFFTLVFVRLQ